MKIKFWGTRGSIPAPGRSTVRYGGNTACTEIRTDGGDLLILDAGTGIRELGISLMESQPVTAHIFIGHTHWDHISGFPFFPPAFAPGNTLTVYAARNIDKRIEEILAGQMDYTYFPVHLEDLPCDIEYHELREERIKVGSARVDTHYLNHTSVCMGYRVEADGTSVAYVSDHEPFGLALLGSNPDPSRLGRGLADGVLHEGDRRLIEWLQGVDVLIQDCQYTPGEYPKKIGWGHGSTDYVVDVALAAGARKLILFHHDPTHSDDFIDQMIEWARERVRDRRAKLEVLGAREGETVSP
ncbi:MAG: MBL fold metallo-hydrolase [Chloroflexota bacterium]